MTWDGVMWLRAWLIRRLGVRECGAFGGMAGDSQRWCQKPFGHIDSCAFDVTADTPASQPGYRLRARFRGWTAPQ